MYFLCTSICGTSFEKHYIHIDKGSVCQCNVYPSSSSANFSRYKVFHNVWLKCSTKRREKNWHHSSPLWGVVPTLRKIGAVNVVAPVLTD
jgi:hypothetical protein